MKLKEYGERIRLFLGLNPIKLKAVKRRKGSCAWLLLNKYLNGMPQHEESLRNLMAVDGYYFSGSSIGRRLRSLQQKGTIKKVYHTNSRGRSMAYYYK